MTPVAAVVAVTPAPRAPEPVPMKPEELAATLQASRVCSRWMRLLGWLKLLRKAQRRWHALGEPLQRYPQTLRAARSRRHR